MASSVTLPTFYDEEILLYQKLNAAMDAIDAKFTAGIGTADLAWPLTAEGNIDMSIYSITGGRQIWGYVNAANYETLADALTAAGSGGVVLVPPETTVTTAGGEAFSGSGAAVIGAGPSSVLRFTDSPTSGYLLRTASGTGLLFADLTFDGNVEAGTSQIGLDLQGVTNTTISRVNFRNFSGPALKISASCSGVKIGECAFDGGAEEHIYATEAGQLAISNCTSDDAGTISLRLESAGAGATVEAVLSNVVITSPGTYGIQVVGYGTTALSSPCSLHASACVVEGSGTGIGVQAGLSTAILRSFSWNGGRVQAGTNGGMLVNAGSGNVSGVSVHTASAYCIDLDNSSNITVSDCSLHDSLIGIDCSDSDLAGCVVHDNAFNGVTTNVSLGENDLVQYNNGGQFGTTGVTGYYAMTHGTIVASTTTNYAPITIPANTLRAGDALSFMISIHSSGVSAMGTVNVRFAGDSIGSGEFWGGADQKFVMNGMLTLLTTTTGESMYMGVPTGVTRQHSVGLKVLSGLDFTTANTVLVDVTSPSGVGGTMHGLTIKIHRGEDQGA